MALISLESYLVLLLKCPIATLSSTLGDFVDEEENYFIRWHNIPPMLANVDGSWSLFQEKIKVQWYFLSFLNTDSTGSQKPSPRRIKTRLPCVVNVVAVDVLVTQRARTLAVMVVTYLSRSILGFWRQKVFITIQLSFMYAHGTWTCSGVLRFKCAVSEPKSFIADCHNATRVTLDDIHLYQAPTKLHQAKTHTVWGMCCSRIWPCIHGCLTARSRKYRIREILV